MPGRVDSRIDTPGVSAIGGERRGVVRVPEFDAAVPGGREEVGFNDLVPVDGGDFRRVFLPAGGRERGGGGEERKRTVVSLYRGLQ